MKTFLDVAEEAAETAGLLIRENWQRAKDVRYKSAINLVTSVDREAEERIVRILQSRFPDHSILAEEGTATSVAGSDHRWILDPLDGTTNFTHAYPAVSVSIALEVKGEIIAGLVYDPIREEKFTAIRANGAQPQFLSLQTIMEDDWFVQNPGHIQVVVAGLETATSRVKTNSGAYFASDRM